MMKDYGVVDSWTKQFTVDLNGEGELIRVLGLQRNGNILVEAYVEGPSRRELSSYDPKSKQVKNLGICGRPHYFHVDNYMENLVLLDKPNYTVSKRRVSRKRKCRSTSDEERVCQLEERLRQQKSETAQLEERLCQQKIEKDQLEERAGQQKTLIQQLETIVKQLTGNGNADRENGHLKSQSIILIQQLRDQFGDMFSGAGDQSATQVQQGSPSANQET